MGHDRSSCSPASSRSSEPTSTLPSSGRSQQHKSARSPSSREQTSELSCLQRHNVRILGTGPQLLFLAHGFGTNQEIWNGVLQSLDLKTKFRVILWDLMGAFSTNPENFDFQRYSSLHAHADDLLEVLEELEVQSIIYVGHSMSGMLGLLASIEKPSLFSRIIVLGTSSRYLNEHETGYHGGFDVSDLDQVFTAMQANYTVWVSGYSAVVVGDSIEAPTVREFSRTLFLIRPDIAFHTMKMIFTTDFREVLKKVQPPVHLLTSQDDYAVPLQATLFMAQNLPNARMEVLPLAGHLPHLTHPALVAAVITRHAEMVYS